MEPMHMLYVAVGIAFAAALVCIIIPLFVFVCTALGIFHGIQ